jgi:hypothetical protein
LLLFSNKKPDELILSILSKERTKLKSRNEKNMKNILISGKRSSIYSVVKLQNILFDYM